MPTFPGGTELVIILIIVLVLFGGAKLPGLARSLGQSMTEFRKASREGAQEEQEAQGGEDDAGGAKGSSSSSERDADS